MKQNEIATTKSNSALMSDGYEENKKKWRHIRGCRQNVSKTLKKNEELGIAINTWQKFLSVHKRIDDL